MALDWVTLLAGAVGGGFLTDYIARTGDRRTARADLVGSQRRLNAARRTSPSSVDDAADEVLRLGIIAGVPTWLIRHYRNVTVAETRSRHHLDPELRRHISHEVGETEVLSHEWALVDDSLKDWASVANEYREAWFWFEVAVWHPWRARVLGAVAWRRAAAKHSNYRTWLIDHPDG